MSFYWTVSYVTLPELLAENTYYVPPYLWETDLKDEQNLKVNQFFSDLYDNLVEATGFFKPLFLGRFGVDKRGSSEYACIVEGSQRLTTLVIYVLALIKRCTELNPAWDINDYWYVPFDLHNFFFSGDHDDCISQDYIQTLHNRDGSKTTSLTNIADAFDYFYEQFSGYSDIDGLEDAFLRPILEGVCCIDLYSKEPFSKLTHKVWNL